MTDVAAEGDAFVTHLSKAVVGAGEGRIEIPGLGDHRQHPASGCHAGTGLFLPAAGMEELPPGDGHLPGVDRIPRRTSPG